MNVYDVTNFDNFLNYGLGDVYTEIDTDLYTILLQPQRSMFYNRTMGVGTIENYPISAIMSILYKTEIVRSIQKRNDDLPTDGVTDRRVATSQNSITIKYDNSGNVDITVLYIPYNNIQNIRQLNTLPGGSNA